MILIQKWINHSIWLIKATATHNYDEHESAYVKINS